MNYPVTPIEFLETPYYRDPMPAAPTMPVAPATPYAELMSASLQIRILLGVIAFLLFLLLVLRK